jgi:hypothetical protein
MNADHERCRDEQQEIETKQRPQRQQGEAGIQHAPSERHAVVVRRFAGVGLGVSVHGESIAAAACDMLTANGTSSRERDAAPATRAP